MQHSANKLPCKGYVSAWEHSRIDFSNTKDSSVFLLHWFQYLHLGLTWKSNSRLPVTWIKWRCIFQKGIPDLLISGLPLRMPVERKLGLIWDLPNRSMHIHASAICLICAWMHKNAIPEIIYQTGCNSLLTIFNQPLSRLFVPKDLASHNGYNEWLLQSWLRVATQHSSWSAY